MDEMYKITIDDGTPISTDEDIRKTAEQLGVAYEDYITALDNHITNIDEIYAYIESLHK